MSTRERKALRLATEAGGWAFFLPKTTETLAEKGFFIKEQHPVYGMQWRITAAGRDALERGE